MEVLMRLYRTIIRSKLYYGCMVYGAVSDSALKSLDAVVNEAMRISTGAFKRTPVKSMNFMTNESQLKLSRNDLLLRCYFKLKCHLINSAYASIVNRDLEMFFHQ